MISKGYIKQEDRAEFILNSFFEIKENIDINLPFDNKHIKNLSIPITVSHFHAKANNSTEK